jgi:hypothetical protein
MNYSGYPVDQLINRSYATHVNQQDRILYERLLRLLQEIDPWLERCAGATPGFKEADAGSPLRGDDHRVHPYETSHAVWGALSHGVDHLHALRSQVREGRAIHNYAPYTLLRTAIENSSVAVWLLAPASRPNRIMRRLRYASTDIKSGEDVKKLIGHAGRRTEAERFDQIRDLATHAQIDPNLAVKPIGFRGIVEAAGEETEFGGKLMRVFWHMGSGIAHGDLWATISVPETVELPGAPAGMRHLRVTAGMDGLLTMTLAAMALTTKGWGLYDLRGRGI